MYFLTEAKKWKICSPHVTRYTATLHQSNDKRMYLVTSGGFHDTDTPRFAHDTKSLLYLGKGVSADKKTGWSNNIIHWLQPVHYSAKISIMFYHIDCYLSHSNMNQCRHETSNINYLTPLPALLCPNKGITSPRSPLPYF